MIRGSQAAGSRETRVRGQDALIMARGEGVEEARGGIR